MKKTYIIPKAFTLEVNTTTMISTSDPKVGINRDGSVSVNAGDVETKGYNPKQKNIWDQQW